MCVFLWEQCVIQSCLFHNWVRWQWVFLSEMDSVCPKELATEISSDSDRLTKVAPTTLISCSNQSPSVWFCYLSVHSGSTFCWFHALLVDAGRLPGLLFYRWCTEDHREWYQGGEMHVVGCSGSPEVYSGTTENYGGRLAISLIFLRRGKSFEGKVGPRASRPDLG